MQRWRRGCSLRPGRSKVKVEACVLIVERWLIGRLRNRVFYSLAELNAAIGDLLRRLNEERPIRRLKQETGRQKTERDFAKLRREQSGRGSLLNYRE
jgi:transposase